MSARRRFLTSLGACLGVAAVPGVGLAFGGRRRGGTAVYPIASCIPSTPVWPVASLSLSTPSDQALVAAGYLHGRHCAVTFQEGIVTANVRASRIRVYASDISWNYGPHGSTRITTPNGNGLRAPSGWRYPGYNQFGIVIYQDGLAPQNVIGTSDATAQEFNINNSRDVRINVNDALGTYGDNWGAFDIYIKVIQN